MSTTGSSKHSNEIEAALEEMEIVGEAELIDRLLAINDEPPVGKKIPKKLKNYFNKGFNPKVGRAKKKPIPAGDDEIPVEKPSPKFPKPKGKKFPFPKKKAKLPDAEGDDVPVDVPAKKKFPPKRRPMPREMPQDDAPPPLRKTNVTRRFPRRGSTGRRPSAGPSDDVSPLEKYATLPVKGVLESRQDLVGEILQWWENEVNSISRENRLTGDEPTEPELIKVDPYYLKEVLAEYINSMHIKARDAGLTLRTVRQDVAEELGIDVDLISSNFLA